MPSILEQAKSLQASNPGRKGVPVVMLAQKNTKDISDFVKTALSKENRWMIQEEEQESIASVLQELSKVNHELSKRCRNISQFHQQAGLYIGMAERIQQLSYCIHLGLDYGFYLIEHRGLKIANAIELSWKRIQDIHKGAKKGIWTEIPVKAPMSSDAQTALNGLFERATPLSRGLLQDAELKDFNCTLSIEKVQKIAHFFQIAQQVYDLEEKGLQESIRTGVPQKESSISLDHIANLLKDLDKKARRFDPNMKNPMLGDSVELNRDSHNDIQFKMRELYIPVLPYTFIQERLDLLNKLCASSKADGVLQFREKITLEAKYLQFFIQTLSIISVTLSQVNSILNNLAISFGKIYRNASPRTISTFFLKRALTTVHALLNKGIRVAKSKRQLAQQIQQMIEKTGLFHPNIAQILLGALEKMEEGQEEISAYDSKLLEYLKQLEEEDMNPKDTYELLCVSYEERVSLSSASAAFDAVIHALIPFTGALKKIFVTHAQVLTIYGKTMNPNVLYEASRRLTTTGATPDPTILQKTESHIEQLNWFIDDVLITNIQEEFRYVQEIAHIFEPVNTRVKQQNIEKAQQKVREKERDERRAAAKEAAAKAAKEAPKKAPGFSIATPKKAKGGAHDPYIPQKMEKLKKCCKELKSEQAEMALYILNKPHMFSSYLDKVAREFDPDGDLNEKMFENEMMHSETTNEFLLAFGKMKLLAHGYLNSHAAVYPYNAKAKKFIIPPKGDKYIEMAPKGLRTPQEAMAKFLDVILGLDDINALSRALSPQSLEILRSDFALNASDCNKIQSALIA